MTSPWETTAGYLLILGALMGLAWLLTVGLAQGARCAASEHERRMAAVRRQYPVPHQDRSNVTPIRRDVIHIPHSRSR